MNKLNFKNIAEELVHTFLEAGKIAKEISAKGIKITIKPDNSPVTNGDLAVDEILRNKIQKLTPDITIISEETVDLNIKNINENFWLIDPIDGTKDYISKKEEYTLNAALIINRIPVIGIIYAPAKDRLFYSYGNKLAFEIRNGNKKNLSCEKKNSDTIIGLHHLGLITEETSNIYKMYKVSKILKMSSSLKFCILASGEADIYAANARAFEWDIAAGHAILTHAGGVMTDHNKKNILYGKHGFKNPSILATRNKDLKK